MWSNIHPDWPDEPEILFSAAPTREMRESRRCRNGCDALLTRLSSVGEPTLDTFGKTNRPAGFDNSAPSIKLNPESKDRKNPFTAGVEADISTQPVCPVIPGPNNSAARFAS